MIQQQDFETPQHFTDDDCDIYAVRGDISQRSAFDRIRETHNSEWDEDIENHLFLKPSDLFRGRAFLAYSEEEGEVIPHVQMTDLNIPADVKTIEVWLLDLA